MGHDPAIAGTRPGLCIAGLVVVLVAQSAMGLVAVLTGRSQLIAPAC